MPSLLEIGLANSVCAAGLAALALLVGRFCRRPAVMHALWLLVLVKLMTPPILSLPLRILPAPEPVAALATATEPTAVVSETPPVQDNPIEGKFLIVPSPNQGDLMIALKINSAAVFMAPEEADAKQSAKPSATARPEPTPSTAGASRIDWQQLRRAALALWIAGAIAWFSVSIRRMVRFQRLLRRARPAPPEIEFRAARLARRMRLPGSPGVAFIPGLVPPLLWMVIGRPTIFLPADLLDQLDETELDTLLAHELAHLRRRDHWVRWLEFVVQGIYWWNPLVILVRRQIQAHEEECCDALVVDLLPARSYATAIVQTLDFLAGAPPIPSAASGLRRVASLKQRLTRILAGNRAGRLGLGGRALLGVLAIGLLPLLPSLAQSTPERTPPPKLTLTASGEQTWDAAGDANDDAIVDLPIEGSSTPRAFCYSPNGRQLALAMENQTVEIRDVATGKCVRILRGHAAAVNCLAYSPDSQMLATGSSDRTVRLWDVRSGKLRRVLSGHESWVYALAFSCDGQTLASAGYDRTVRLWNPANGSAIATLKGHDSAVRALAFSHDGQTLASGGGDQRIQIWDVVRRQIRATLIGHSDTVRALAFSSNGQTLASAGDDGSVRLWDPRTGVERATLAGHTAEVTSLAFAPFGQMLVSAGMDRTIRWWDTVQNRELALIPANRDGVIGMAFAPHHNKLTILSQDRLIRQMPLSRVAVNVRPTESKNQMYLLAEKPFASRRTVSVARLEAKQTELTVTDADALPRILILEIKRAQ